MIEFLKCVGVGAVEVIGGIVIFFALGGVFLIDPPKWLKITSEATWAILILYLFGAMTRYL